MQTKRKGLTKSFVLGFLSIFFFSFLTFLCRAGPGALLNFDWLGSNKGRLCNTGDNHNKVLWAQYIGHTATVADVLLYGAGGEQVWQHQLHQHQGQAAGGRHLGSLPRQGDHPANCRRPHRLQVMETRGESTYCTPAPIEKPVLLYCLFKKNSFRFQQFVEESVSYFVKIIQS